MPNTQATAPGQISDFVSSLRTAGLYPDIPVLASASTDPLVEVDGREQMLFCSNNLLGLSNHPGVKAAAAAALERYGLGSGGSRMMAANIDVHVELERRIASFLGREDAICFAAGYMANVGVIPALMKIGFLSRLDVRQMTQDFEMHRAEWEQSGRWDIFSEALNHASDVDGIRLALADTHIYEHKNMAMLAKLLETATHASKLIISDGVFSMDGDIAPLPGIVKIAAKHGAMVMIDDAHGVGMLGANGRGTLEHYGVAPATVHLQMGTFTKAFGGLGGYVAGDKALIDYLRVSARTYIFSAPLPPAIAAGLIASIDIATREPWRREKALENAHFFRQQLEATGYDTLGSQAHIVPALIGSEENAARMTRALRERGIVAPNARFPAVAPGRARFRFVMTCEHTREQIGYLLRCLAELKDELKLG